MDFNRLLHEKKTFITTGAQGIGKDIARLFLEQGAYVCLGARNEEKLKTTIEELKNISSDIQGYVFDLSQKDETETACEQILRDHDHIDVLVNTVGINRRGPIHESDDALFEELIETNYLSGLRCARKLVPQMIRRKSGSIVNISSIHALMTMPGFGVYAGTKGAMNATARAMALDYAKHKIRVNTVCPGLIMSDVIWQEVESYPEGEPRDNFIKELNEMQPLSAGQVEDVSNAVLYFASSLSSYVTGQVLMVDGGASIKAH